MVHPVGPLLADRLAGVDPLSRYLGFTAAFSTAGRRGTWSSVAGVDGYNLAGDADTRAVLP